MHSVQFERKAAEQVWHGSVRDHGWIYHHCDRIAVLADRRVLVTGTMAELRDVETPWVHDYFNGPRAHVAPSGIGT